MTTARCKLIEGKPTANEHDKLIWLSKENLISLNWAPADIPAVEQLAKEKCSTANNSATSFSLYVYDIT